MERMVPITSWMRIAIMVHLDDRFDRESQNGPGYNDKRPAESSIIRADGHQNNFNPAHDVAVLLPCKRIVPINDAMYRA